MQGTLVGHGTAPVFFFLKQLFDEALYTFLVSCRRFYTVQRKLV
jgi:hypothetical protein